MTITAPPIEPPLPKLPRLRLEGNILAILSTLVWSAGFPAADALLRHYNPLPIVFLRFAIASVALIIVWLALRGPRAVFNAPWRQGVLLGGAFFGLGAYMLILAQSLTDGVTVAIVSTAAPVIATVVEMFYQGRRISAGFAAGLVAAVIGGLVATGHNTTAHLGLGALICILSNVVFSWGSYLTVARLGGQGALERTTLTLTGGTVFTGLVLAFGVALGRNSLPLAAFDLQDAFNIAVYGLGGLALSQFLWIASVEKIGVALAAFHINAAPFYVMMILLALGQGWSWSQALGAAIVAAGVVMAQR